MSLVEAILTLTLIWSGRVDAHARHMRPDPELRAIAMSEAFEIASRDFEIDPRVLVALAWSESGFDGRRVGKLGETGIMQLHPRTRLGIAYRKACPAWSLPCDAWSIYLGAEKLAQGVKRCNDLELAIGWYKTGKCVKGPQVMMVMRTVAWMGGES